MTAVNLQRTHTATSIRPNNTRIENEFFLLVVLNPLLSSWKSLRFLSSTVSTVQYKRSVLVRLTDQQLMKP